MKHLNCQNHRMSPSRSMHNLIKTIHCPNMEFQFVSKLGNGSNKGSFFFSQPRNQVGCKNIQFSKAPLAEILEFSLSSISPDLGVSAHLLKKKNFFFNSTLFIHDHSVMAGCDIRGLKSPVHHEPDSKAVKVEQSSSVRHKISSVR